MIPQSRITGFITKRSNFGEADKTITVFSRQLGKTRLVAKGVRRIKSRRAPHLELFNLAAIAAHSNIITEAKLINDYSYLKADLKMVGYLYYIFEIINKIVPENEPHVIIFDLLVDTLAKNIDEERVKSLMVKIIWDLGYLPHGELPQTGVTAFLESIAERRINSKKFIDNL